MQTQELIERSLHEAEHSLQRAQSHIEGLQRATACQQQDLQKAHENEKVCALAMARDKSIGVGFRARHGNVEFLLGLSAALVAG